MASGRVWIFGWLDKSSETILPVAVLRNPFLLEVRGIPVENDHQGFVVDELSQNALWTFLFFFYSILQRTDARTFLFDEHCSSAPAASTSTDCFT